MNIFSAFKTHIATAVPSLLGRVFPAGAVEGYDSPYCAYELISANRLQTLDGYAGEVYFDYQFNFYSHSYDSAKINANLFWDYIHPYKGTFGDYTLGEVEHLTESDSSDLIVANARFNAILELRFKCTRI